MVTIKMAGIEHEKAAMEDRELFAFSSHTCTLAMKYIKENYGIPCILISTCNRTELWINLEELSEQENVISPFKILCSLKQVSEERFQDIAVEREGEEAVMHLFRLSCGMKSKIFGEDQIITQVKNALSLARESETVDTVLEKLFQSAVTAAKKVKTQVKLLSRKPSVVELMLERLYQDLSFTENRQEKIKEQKKDLSKKQNLRDISCLVIGNGEIGRLAASRLLEEGAKVTMTLRQYKNHSAVIPDGCRIIPYQERLKGLEVYTVIVSTTASPHYTLHYEDTKPILNDNKKRILFDLAMPRDISFRLSELSNLTLYNIDSLGGIKKEEAEKEELDQAERILSHYFLEYKRWYYFRDFVPIVYGISRAAAVEVYKRLEHPFKKLKDSDEEKAALEKMAKGAVERVVSSMLYGLREHLSIELWEECFHAIEDSILDSV